MDHERIMSTKEVTAFFQISRSTLWRYERAGAFPRRLKLSPRKVCYLASEVEQWIEAKKAKR